MPENMIDIVLGVSVETDDDYKGLETLLNSLERFGNLPTINVGSKESTQVIDDIAAVNRNVKKSDDDVKQSLFDVKSTLYNKIDQIWQQIRMVPPRYGGSPAQQIEFFRGLQEGKIDITSGMDFNKAQVGVINRMLGQGDPKALLDDFLKNTVAPGGLNLAATSPSATKTLVKYIANLTQGTTTTPEIGRILSLLNPETKLKQMQFGVKQEYGLENIRVPGKGGVFESEQSDYVNVPEGFMDGKTESPVLTNQKLEGFVNRFLAENLQPGETFAKSSNKSDLIDKFRKEYGNDAYLQDTLSSKYGFKGRMSRLLLGTGRSFDKDFLKGMKGSLKTTSDIGLTVYDKEVGNINSIDDMRKFMLNFQDGEEFTGSVGESGLKTIWDQFNIKKGVGGNIPLTVELKDIIDQSIYSSETGGNRMSPNSSILAASSRPGIIQTKGINITELTPEEQKQFFSQTQPDQSIIDKIVIDSQVNLLQSLKDEVNEVGLKKTYAEPNISKQLTEISNMIKEMMRKP